MFYVLLRAIDMFHEQHNTYPGWYTDQVEADVNKLKVGRRLWTKQANYIINIFLKISTRILSHLFFSVVPRGNHD